MPAPERTGSEPREPDTSAIPSFLRDDPRSGRSVATSDAGARRKAALAIPRPSTPMPAPAAAPRPEPALDPATLPMPSLSRRRVVTAAGVLLASLLLLGFARQVSEATAASNRATELRAANAALRDEVARLEEDLGHVRDVRFIRLEGRAYGLGGPHEIPFALAAGAPALDADAPGSASVRLGAVPRALNPLDAWLEVLFGAGR
jgi:hypothetical protein